MTRSTQNNKELRQLGKTKVKTELWLLLVELRIEARRRISRKHQDKLTKIKLQFKERIPKLRTGTKTLKPGKKVHSRLTVLKMLQLMATRCYRMMKESTEN